MAPVPDAVAESLANILSLAKRSGPASRNLAVKLIRRGDSILISTSTAALQSFSRRQENNADTATDTTRPQKTFDFEHGAGTIRPESIPTNALFAIFGLIGAGFVITAIWFFFITPNGGFVFKDGDWEEYKSTVLRRKGPNGTTLSGATESTDLGGGSVVGWRERRRFREKGERSDFTEDTSYTGYSKSDISGSTAVTDSLVGTEYTRTEDAMTSITRGVSGQYKREKVTGLNRRDQLKQEKERAKAAKRAEKEAKERRKQEEKASKKNRKYHDEESSIGFPAESVYDPFDGAERAAEGYDDRDIRSYRHEQPATVGGINRPTDSTAFGSSYLGSDVTESLISGRQDTPENSPKKKSTRERRERGNVYSEVSVEPPSPTKARGGAGIRKVDTVYEADRIKAEQRRLRDRARAAAANSSAAAEASSSRPKRDFSFARGDDGLSAVSEESREERRQRREERRRARESRNPPGGYQDSEVSGLSGTTADTESTGTKAYHHVIPGLTSPRAAREEDGYAEERRRRRAEGANYKR